MSNNATKTAVPHASAGGQSSPMSPSRASTNTMLWSLAIIMASCCLPGCGSGSKTSNLSMSQIEQMVLDRNDADRRRSGIQLLAQRKDGLGDRPCQLYTQVAMNRSEQPSVRAAALDALGRAGRRADAPTIAQCLDDDSQTVRWSAANALDRSVDEAAIEPLRKHAIGDQSLDVRAACAQALRHYHRRDVMATLVGCLNDREFSVRFKAHNSLVQMAGTDRGYDTFDWEPEVQRAPTTLPSQPAGR